MIDATSGDAADHASVLTAKHMDRLVQRNADNAVRDFTILFERGGETVEDRFTGTKDERIDHLTNVPIERNGGVIPPLDLDLETAQWAAGFYDWHKMCWQTCGSNEALIRQVKRRPRPA